MRMPRPGSNHHPSGRQLGITTNAPLRRTTDKYAGSFTNSPLHLLDGCVSSIVLASKHYTHYRLVCRLQAALHHPRCCDQTIMLEDDRRWEFVAGLGHDQQRTLHGAWNTPARACCSSDSRRLDGRAAPFHSSLPSQQSQMPSLTRMERTYLGLCALCRSQ